MTTSCLSNQVAQMEISELGVEAPHEVDKRSWLCGIDPGSASGGIACLTDQEVRLWSFSKVSIHDVAQILRTHRIKKAWIEKVWGYPGTQFVKCPLCKSRSGFTCVSCFKPVELKQPQGIATTGRFMRATGEIIGVLAALDIPYEEILPRQWQTIVGIRRQKGTGQTDWKRQLKARAQELYPRAKLTLHTADALLIVEALRRAER
jgi:Holliday junction resolvasome RuvABC endonuclease subunit